MVPQKRPITIEDVYHIAYVEDPRISPDGRWVAYVRVIPDRLENGYQRNIWLVPTGGGQAIQLTRSNKDSAPRWSPDGKMLAFVSSRDKKPQIYVLRVAAPGGEARAITKMPGGATQPAWSPDGTQIAFVSNRIDDVYQIYLYDLATDAVEVLTNDTTVNNHSPQWLPGGDAIVFQTLGGNYSYDRQTYRLNLRDGSIRPLTPVIKYMDMLVWRP